MDKKEKTIIVGIGVAAVLYLLWQYSKNVSVFTNTKPDDKYVVLEDTTVDYAIPGVNYFASTLYTFQKGEVIQGTVTTDPAQRVMAGYEPAQILVTTIPNTSNQVNVPMANLELLSKYLSENNNIYPAVNNAM